MAPRLLFVSAIFATCGSSVATLLVSDRQPQDPGRPPAASLSQLLAGSQLGAEEAVASHVHQHFMSLEVQRIAWNEAARLQHSGPKARSGAGKSLDHSLPRPQLTLFKGLFGLGFVLCLAATCAARQLGGDGKEPGPSERIGRAAKGYGAMDAPEATLGPGKAAAGADPPSQAPPAAEPSRNVQLAKAAVTVFLWMVFSIFFIIFNKYMFSKGGFPYPVTLTAMHMGSCYFVFGCVRFLPSQWSSALMPDADKHIPLNLYVKGLVPAALLMAICLGIGNLGFLYATVAFIQMVKPVNIVVTSLAGFAWGLEQPTATHFFIAIIVSGGVAIAAAGEAEFSLAGLVCQLVASTGEGLRLIILQGIMQGSLKLDPLTTLYRFTPVAGLALCVLSCLIESPVNWQGLKMPGVLVLNCLMAIGLNVLIAAVVKQTSAVVFVLAGVTKDIATIAISSAMYHNPVTSQEVGGYAISVIGICLFKVYKDNLQIFRERGMIRGFVRCACDLFPGKGEHSL